MDDIIKMDDIIALNAVISLIYEAAYQPERWAEALAAVAAYTDSHSSALVYRHQGTPDAELTQGYNITQDATEAYLMKYAKLDPFPGLHAALSIPLGVAASDSQLLPSRHELEENHPEFFNNYMARFNQYYMGGATLFQDNERLALVTVQRGQEQGPWPDGCMDRLTTITPHLQRAFRIHTEFTRLRSVERSLYMGLDRLMIGVILIDQYEKVTYLNPVAESVIRKNGCLQVYKNKLKAHTQAETIVLSNAIRECMHYNNSVVNARSSITLGVRHPDHSNPLPILVASVAASDVHQFCNDSAIKVAVFISDPQSPNTISTQPLMEVYGLTRAEANVAIALANGNSLESISANNNVSVHTVRSQLKSIYKKTYTSRQHELVKLLLTGPFTAVTPK